MAQTRNEDLFNALRAHGLRRKMADEVARIACTDGQAEPDGEQVARRAIEDLTCAAEDIRNSVLARDRSRSAAAKKAAQTRKAKAAQRSATAKKGAQTRARVTRTRATRTTS